MGETNFFASKSPNVVTMSMCPLPSPSGMEGLQTCTERLREANHIFDERSEYPKRSYPLPYSPKGTGKRGRESKIWFRSFIELTGVRSIKVDFIAFL